MIDPSEIKVIILFNVFNNLLTGFIVEPACVEQDIVVTITVCVCACIRLSEFVWNITFSIVDGFQNNLTQLFSMACRCVI